jgi:hypothetical protein
MIKRRDEPSRWSYIDLSLEAPSIDALREPQG